MIIVTELEAIHGQSRLKMLCQNTVILHIYLDYFCHHSYDIKKVLSSKKAKHDQENGKLKEKLHSQKGNTNFRNNKNNLILR